MGSEHPTGSAESQPPTPNLRLLPSHPKRILLIGPSNIGDALLASEVIAAMSRRDPDGHLTLVVGARAKALFEGDRRVHTLVDADAFAGPLGRLKLALALWRYHPHIVVDLRHTALPLLLKPLQSWRYLRRPPRTLRHMRDRHLWDFRAQAPDAAQAPSREDVLWCSERDIAQVEQLWKRWQVTGRSPVIVMAPGARSPIKRWTAEGFAVLADALIAQAGAEIIFSGEPREAPIIEGILAAMHHKAHNAVGLMTIRQLGLIMRRARLVVTNDSASLHLASVLDVPTLAIFGPTDENKYGPTASKHRTVRRRLFCAPCEEPKCRFNHECMRFIPAEEVLAAALELLGARGEGQGAREERGAGKGSSPGKK